MDIHGYSPHGLQEFRINQICAENTSILECWLAWPAIILGIQPTSAANIFALATLSQSSPVLLSDPFCIFVWDPYWHKHPWDLSLENTPTMVELTLVHPYFDLRLPQKDTLCKQCINCWCMGIDGHNSLAYYNFLVAISSTQCFELLLPRPPQRGKGALQLPLDRHGDTRELWMLKCYSVFQT